MLVRLSNRQRKDVLIDGFAIDVAIPVPAGTTIENPLAFAHSALVDDGISDCVTDAIVAEVPVATPRPGSTIDDAPPWGHIVDNRPHPDRLTHYVVAVIATLQKRANPRAHKIPAWPKAISLDGGKTWHPDQPGSAS